MPTKSEGEGKERRPRASVSRRPLGARCRGFEGLRAGDVRQRRWECRVWSEEREADGDGQWPAESRLGFDPLAGLEFISGL